MNSRTDLPGMASRIATFIDAMPRIANLRVDAIHTQHIERAITARRRGFDRVAPMPECPLEQVADLDHIVAQDVLLCQPTLAEHLASLTQHTCPQPDAVSVIAVAEQRRKIIRPL